MRLEDWRGGVDAEGQACLRTNGALAVELVCNFAGTGPCDRRGHGPLHIPGGQHARRHTDTFHLNHCKVRRPASPLDGNVLYLLLLILLQPRA